MTARRSSLISTESVSLGDSPPEGKVLELPKVRVTEPKQVVRLTSGSERIRRCEGFDRPSDELLVGVPAARPDHDVGARFRREAIQTGCHLPYCRDS